MSKQIHILIKDGETMEFTAPNEHGMVRIYFSAMGDDNWKNTEAARDVYRAAKANGWAPAK